LFNAPALAGKIAFRGGTAIHKLLFKQPLRYSEDTREHDSVLGIQQSPFAVENGWYQATASIASFAPEELFGTKLRALLQRRKNRDLFDLHMGLQQLSMNPEALLACFDHYVTLEAKPITRANAEQRMLEKLTHSLTEDMAPLLPPGIKFHEDDAVAAFESIWNILITRINGDPWKQTDRAIEELRKKKYPTLLRR
jgi:predicted nucleotidyltransferase component of viral defense system